MAKFIIADEVNDSRTADVLSSGALEVAPVYVYARIPSGTASGTIAAASVYLHSVVVGTVAAAGRLVIAELTSSANAAPAVGEVASAVAGISTDAVGTYLFDCYVAGNLCYRLSGLDNPGITVTYQLA